MRSSALGSQRLVCMCDQALALQNEKLFTKELEIFDKEGLERHIEQHPKCQFCQKPEYSSQEILRHMDEQHFVCYVCLSAHLCVFFGDPCIIEGITSGAILGSGPTTSRHLHLHCAY